MSDQNNSLYENSEYPSRRQAPQEEPKPRRRRKKRRRSIIGTFFKALGTLILVGLCTGALLACFAAMYMVQVIVPLADLSLDDFELGENSVMYYQDKETGEYEEMVTLLNVTSSIWVDYEEIPQDLVNATVAIEDQRFWTHPGIDWRRTGRAVLDMFMGNDISGGSTITQQMIKNLTDYDETTVKRKLIEIVRALRVTQNTSKEDVMTLYLNIIPLGSKCEGVGSASYQYFGKPVSELTLAECASLISITNNPSKYGPYSSARVPTESTGELWTAKQWNKWRQELVLSNMLKYEMITQEEYDEAVAQELVFIRGDGESDAGTVYNWYEETVIADVKADLVDKLGWSEKRAEQVMSRGGLRIYSCMDPEVQTIVEEIYTNRENLNYASSDGQLMQSAITVIDNATGDVVAIAGQFGEKTGNLWSNFANDPDYRRQPGSSIKPLSVYSPAFEMGLISPITVLDDYPYSTNLNAKGEETPWPVNSGTAKYGGLTTVRTALTKSLNTIAVRVLADRVTPRASFDFVQERYGIQLVDALAVGDQIKSDIDVAPLSMGGLTYGVTTRDMAQAYATFANNGVYTQSRTYTKVTQLVDGHEVVLLDNAQKQKMAIKETTAYYINDILQDVLVTGTGKGHQLTNMPAAGKTGTTSDNKDRWFVGYTPYYTAAVWTGYAIPAKMPSGNRSLDLWEMVMEEIHADLEKTDFYEPSGLKPVSYCMDSGLLATEYCKLDPRGSRVAEDKIFAEDIPDGLYCTAHTEASLFDLCMDSPIMDMTGVEPGAEGEAALGKDTGMDHIAGPYCPAESLVSVCLPSFERLAVGEAVASDEMYRKQVVEGHGICSVHLEPEVTEDPWWDPWLPDIWGGEEEPDSGLENIPQDIPQDIPSQDLGDWLRDVWSW